MKLYIPALCFLIPASALAQAAPPTGAPPDILYSSRTIAAAMPFAARPLKPAAALSVYSSYAAPEGLISRRTGITSEAALGSAGGLAFRALADMAHIRSLCSGYFPGELYRMAFGLTAEKRRTRLALSLNSNSDRPFNSPSETDLGFNFSRDLSAGSGTWIAGLNYSTRRSFMRGMPMPYLGYRYTTKDLTLVLPFMARWQASRSLALSASYQPIKYFKAGLSWSALPRLRADLEGGLALEQFLPAGRADKSQELFYQTSYISLKPSLLFSNLEITPAVGWQFSGLYYMGTRYDDYKAKTRLRGGPTIGLSLKYAI